MKIAIKEIEFTDTKYSVVLGNYSVTFYFLLFKFFFAFCKLEKTNHNNPEDSEYMNGTKNIDRFRSVTAMNALEG